MYTQIYIVLLLCSFSKKTQFVHRKWREGGVWSVVEHLRGFTLYIHGYAENGRIQIMCRQRKLVSSDIESGTVIVG